MTERKEEEREWYDSVRWEQSKSRYSLEHLTVKEMFELMPKDPEKKNQNNNNEILITMITTTFGEVWYRQNWKKE